MSLAGTSVPASILLVIHVARLANLTTRLNMTSFKLMVVITADAAAVRPDTT